MRVNKSSADILPYSADKFELLVSYEKSTLVCLGTESPYYRAVNSREALKVFSVFILIFALDCFFSKWKCISVRRDQPTDFSVVEFSKKIE